MSGIITSSNIKSGRNSRAVVRAALPEFSVRTSKRSLDSSRVRLMTRVKAEPEFTLVGGILRFETFGREVQKQLDKEVNVPDADMVQFVAALGAAVLGHRRIETLKTEGAQT